MAKCPKQFRVHGVVWATLLAIACGCGSGEPATDGGADVALDVDVAVDADTVPPTPSTNWCDRVAPGPPADTSLPEGLSAVHAAARFFAAEPADGATIPYVVVGEALATALDRVDPWTPASLVAFADALDSVCAMEVTDATLHPVSVEMVGDVALITPGTGPVTLPPGVTAVALDLRGLPSVPGLWQALADAASPALNATHPRLMRRLRRHHGMVEEYLFEASYYRADVVEIQPPGIELGHSHRLPIGLLTGPVLAPAAAELAITLRSRRRAWLIGEDVLTHVAEARWYGVNDTHGAVLHVRSLLETSERIPDVVPADVRHVDPAFFLPMLPTAGYPPAIPTDVAQRPPLLASPPAYGACHPPTITPGTVRAALLSAYGALRLFFPYFHIVGDNIDERLAELIDQVDAAETYTRTDVWHWLWRFGETLHDSHNYAWDSAPDPAVTGCLPVLLEHIDGEIVVGRSETTDLDPGDTITTIDGEATGDWLARWWPIYGAAADGWRFHQIVHFELTSMTGPRTLEIRDPDGLLRTTTPTPSSCNDRLFVREPRTSGYLADLGAPNLYYLNLDREVMVDEAEMLQALVEADGAAGMVLDARGYPAFFFLELASRLLDHDIDSWLFYVPEFVGPDARTLQETSFFISSALNPHFHGPMVLLIGPRSTSAPETLGGMLADAGRFEAVVGSQSGAVTGDLTSLVLPGGFAFSFTGMEGQHADHTTYHGIGVLPDVEVIPTPTQLRDGIDPELEAGVNILLNLP